MRVQLDKHGDPRSGAYVGPKAGREIGAGKVAKSLRWWSYDWWSGHHFGRAEDGEWAPEGVRRTARSRARRITRDDYQAYLDARYNAAEGATNGAMLSPGGHRRGISPRSKWFSGRRGTPAGASEELADWFRDHGRPMTFREFAAQHTEHEHDGRSVYAGIY